MLKTQKKEQSNEKLEILMQKSQENFEKAEEINYILSSFRTPSIKKQVASKNENHE